jgi:hypothetical protein
VTPGGYWHYRIQENYTDPVDKQKVADLYVPNNGYLVVLWDPGLAKPIKDNFKPIEFTDNDFYRIFTVLKNMGTDNLSNPKRPVYTIPTHITHKFDKFLKYIFYETTNLNANLNITKNNNLFSKFFTNKIPHNFEFLITDPSKLPPNAKIINKTPYYL